MNGNDPFGNERFGSSPFEKDTIGGKKSEKNVLSEEDFIQESPNSSRFPPWLWIFLVTTVVALLGGSTNWYQGFLKKEVSSRPFLEVTNREFSVFLWQFPSFMRSNVKRKAGYLTGFEYEQKETLNLSQAEDYVVAPPDLIFLYHTWNRLLAPEYIVRPIPANEFQEFLSQVKEWHPDHWKNAPESYVNWVSKLEIGQENDLQEVTEKELPLMVRQAFQGWKNYFKEGPEINQVTPTFEQIRDFLKEHPDYARHYWRNIEMIANQKVAGPTYLSGLLEKDVSGDEKIPKNQLSSFLKVAFFNAEQAKKGQ